MSKGGDKRNAPRPGHQSAHTSFVRAESAVTAPYAPMAPGLARAPACGGSAASGLRGAQNLRQCWARARVSRLRRSRVGGDRPLIPVLCSCFVSIQANKQTISPSMCAHGPARRTHQHSAVTGRRGEAAAARAAARAGNRGPLRCGRNHSLDKKNDRDERPAHGAQGARPRALSSVD